MQEEEILEQLQILTQKDLSYSSGRVLGSMCTIPDPIVPRVMNLYLEKNIGDPGLLPGMTQVEDQIIHTLGEWLGSDTAVGQVLTGATEANILALWHYKKSSQDPHKNQVIIPNSAHFSFDKALDFLDLQGIRIPVDECYRVQTEEVEARVREETLAIVGIAGNTGLGVSDDIPALGQIAQKHQIPLHVDAAFGGFVLPFLDDPPAFDFRVPGVTSLCLDPHKMGRGPIPSGCLLFRDEHCRGDFGFTVDYLSGGHTRHNTLVGTRSGAVVAAVWAVLQKYGFQGFKDLIQERMALTKWLVDQIKNRPYLGLVREPETNVVGLTFPGKDPQSLAKRLRQDGWALSEWDHWFRIVLMPHVKKSHLEDFLSYTENLNRITLE
jgi:tyrosine decarboxylase/aspartate 1-decarboxylase